MDPAQESKLLVTAGLHPDGKAVEARLLYFLQKGEIHRAGVYLQGDLRILADEKPCAQEGQQFAQPPRTEQGGGAAAEIHGADLTMLGEGVRLLFQGFQVSVLGIFRYAGQGVKGAIVALSDTKGDVQIQPQALLNSPIHCSMLSSTRCAAARMPIYPRS